MNDRIQGSSYDNPYWYRSTWRIYCSHDDDDRPGFAFCDDATGAEGFAWSVADAARRIDELTGQRPLPPLRVPPNVRDHAPWLVIALGAVAWAVVIVGGLLLAQVIHALLEPGGTVGARWPW